MNQDQSPDDNAMPGPDEIRLASLIGAIETDAPAPDTARLGEIRQRTLAVFAQAADAKSLSVGDEGTKSVRSQSFAALWRGLTALVATAAVLWLGINLFTQNSVRGAPFSKVLENLRSAKTLELRITRDGQSAQIWVRAPGLVRIEDSPHQYRIAQGSRLWKIDETTNTAAAVDSPWFINSEQQIDLLGLLELDVKDAKPLLAAEPAEQTDYANRKCFVYRADLAGGDGQLRIEAFADVATGELLGIIANPLDRARGTGPPLAELQLVARNTPVDESKFVIAKSLTDDGRIGKIVDAQGLVVLRPALAQRWTPVGAAMPLKPGDWLRTDLRGANAARARLSSDVELTLGPGSLLECISPTKARLHAGELQVNLPKSTKTAKTAKIAPPSFELSAPHTGSKKFTAAGKQLVRIDRNEKLAEVVKRPQWLEGFEGTSSNESLGSLIVKLPDGRNEPLSVGFHKVNVEIRDQIARTTIEESFVNHTPSRLEGVFYFPLPADASISGFGMWIGNDLVEADVVEKQRAREIYETILREKKDPGLLEWTVGNLFKARVFPIEAMSEKRIKIVYSQVLPLRANIYRYSYGLRSDLLRTKPLRELSLSVQVNSAVPLKNVTCPTHSVRTAKTQHSAQIDFSAQEYTPDRDFELVCEIENRSSDVVVIPHRRGDNGYFLLQLMPPAREGNWRREVLPDGKPLELVLLCDTSASMDREKRKQQAEFVATVLASLGDKDRFWLAASDVETVWSSPEAQRATRDNIRKARKFLDDRNSLGWTNLDRAFEAVLKNASSGSQIVYIGDGIVTAGESNPNSFVKKLGRLIGDVKSPDAERSFHAITVGNTYDATVLRGIAAVGHGSVRSIAGDRTPQAVAKELLNEIAQPGLRDLSIEFRGLKVGAIYPEVLPQVPAGTQQILVGRYLPTGKDQHGEVIVTGKLGSESVRFAASIDLKDAEAGNSFIPRLWARAHLDHLLQQGSGPAIRDEVITLSEQFHIITPYTSLLVLESDADRERFGVKRHIEMRDGERFFAEGSGNAKYELRQQQMKRAGDWRIGMRRRVLQGLSNLGRNSQMFQQRVRALDEWNRRLADDGIYQAPGAAISLSGGNPYGGEMFISDGSMSNSGFLAVHDRSGGTGGGGGQWWDRASTVTGFTEPMTLPGFSGNSPDFESLSESADGETESAGPHGLHPEGPADVDLADKDAFDVRGISLGVRGPAASSPVSGEDWQGFGPYGDKHEMSFETFDVSDFDQSADLFNKNGREVDGDMGLFGNRLFDAPASPGWGRRSRVYLESSAKRLDYRPDYMEWVNTLFPRLAAPMRDPSKPARKPKKQGELPEWPTEAIALSKSLSRLESLWKLDGGIQLRRTTETFDPRWKRTSSRRADLILYSPKSWLTRGLEPSAETLINYCDEKERGFYSLAKLLGRSRKAYSGDLKTPPFDLADSSLSPLHEAFRNYRATIAPAGENKSTLILKPKGSKTEIHFLIDTARHVVLKQESIEDGKVVSTTTFSEFVELGGSWWARTVTTADGKGRKTSETKLEISSLAQEKYRARVNDELAAKPHVQFLRLPGPTLKVARQHVANGTASFEDFITMMLYNSLIQQWDELLKQLEAAERLTVDKPGVQWIRTVILQSIRRNNEARLRLLENARKLAAGKQPDEAYLAEFIIGQSQSVASPAEQLEFVNILRPVYDRQQKSSHAESRWRELLLNCYDALSRHEEALALRGKLAEELPWDISRHTDYATRLLAAGQAESAYSWLKKQLDRDIEFDASTDETLRTAYAGLYRSQARWQNLLAFTTAWIARNPEYNAAYEQHLSALVYNDKLGDADTLAQSWLKESQIKVKLSPQQRAKLNAAISYAHGDVYGMQSNNQASDRWMESLAQTARFFVPQKEHLEIVNQIVNEGGFFESAHGDRFRGFVLSLLQSRLQTLSPEQIRTFIGWSLSGRIELAEPIRNRKQLDASEIPARIWKQIADQLHGRWKKTEDKDEKNDLSESLQSIYAARFNDSELLPFLRERMETGPADYRLSYISALFEALIGRKWTDENEKEAFALLTRLIDSDEPADVLSVEVPALYRLVDAMIVARQARANEELRDKGGTQQLTRTQLAAKRIEFDKAAKEAVASRLGKEAEKASAALAPWLRMEKAYLNLQLNQDLPQAAEMSWKLLGEAPAVPKQIAEEAAIEMGPEALADIQRTAFFDAVLRIRAFTTVENLAARRNAQPAAVNRVLKYIDAGIARGGENTAPWRAAKFQMLVALDRPDELERELRAWVRSEESTSPWRKALAMLLAERGRIDEAIRIFEALEKDRLLTAADYRTLSNWYLVSNRRGDYEKARIEAYKQLPEQALANMFWGIRSRWMRTDLPLPSQLDDNTLFAMRSLFEKSSSPENYFWQLRDLYMACRDFRLLDMLPDAVLGRSPQQIYNFLQSMQGSVLVEVHNEAAADEILSRIKKIREPKLTQTDQRALDLMEALVERRSSEVLNQPGPHITACVAALKRGFDYKWSSGEPILMAGFLRNLGKLAHAPLIDEQIRELRVLQKNTKAASRERLQITDHMCNLLFWSYEQKDSAIEEMESEVRAYEQAHAGHWPHADNEILGSYVHLLEGANRFAAGEEILLKYLARPESDEQRKWLNGRLSSLYNSALESGGEVTLGKRNTLFKNIVARGLKELDTSPDENVRHNVVTSMVNTFDIARRKNLKDTAKLLRSFAFQTMPTVLKMQQNNYQGMATAPLQVIAEVLGPKVALQYIVERMEQYPARLESSWNNAWQTFGYELARRRRDTSKTELGDLAPRVLKLVVAEIQRHIRTGQSTNQSMFYMNNEYFWSEKANDFAQAAEEVYTKDKNSGRNVMAVARYLHAGLNLPARAIEILLVAHRDGLLEEAGQIQLVQWLHDQKRFAESIPILEPLVEQHPNTMRYRTQLMVAYHRSQRRQQLLDLVKSTDTYFHQGGRWTDVNVAEFGEACGECALEQNAVAYLTEAISIHQRTNGQVVLGDAALSEWYQHLASAHSALHHTEEAVDAASGAIVCWSPRQNERRDALRHLTDIVRKAADLPAYIKYLDEQAEKTGEDSAILRKAIGDALRDRKEFQSAIRQLQTAAQLEPNDKEIHQALIACYDATENKAAGTQQLLTLIELDSHNLALYSQLAERLKEQPADEERAVTSIVEAGPQEAENHTALAEIRQKQNRWDNAIGEWAVLAKLQSLEPTGLLKLAEAQIHQKQWDAARKSVETLQRTAWPSRFGDVSNQTRSLQEKLPK
jgi:hypothetical protein